MFPTCLAPICLSLATRSRKWKGVMFDADRVIVIGVCHVSLGKLCDNS